MFENDEVPATLQPGEGGEITSWLKKTFENQLVPQFDVNTKTTDLLYELVEYSEERERDVSFLIEDMKKRAAEYDAGAEYLQSLLTESLGLSPSSLSEEGTAHLNTLVDSAMILETKDTYLTSFFCAISDRTLELHAAESKNKEMEQRLVNLKKKLTATLVLEKQLEKDLEKTKTHLEIEVAKSENRLQNLQFLEDKSEDLKIRIKTAEEQLAASGLDQSLLHESLVSMSEKLAEMQEEMVHVKKKLEYYLDLPPNLSLARVKVEEAKRELNALEEEFSKQIEMLTHDVQETKKL
ncbi:HAUS augmin-like complex subunit 1 isoform X1 [Gallus gallus]|uniref:HAUS augmin like complex subunit 1 n=1 Tax=Gallus gallus TaxID=9031 RepID=A0A8V0YG61_CHICK|nr:HAUS augmin-like complex subunit 1 isoform X1 [Gallus gallus]XP_046790898.1 HAUS augmin-like complex subunit 1 isoform X1 [Gallus gallus]|eukprot:XP_015132764.1 HAUS augmin-like complex subunit 1 isoform X1 [Gallus gallus]